MFFIHLLLLEIFLKIYKYKGERSFLVIGNNNTFRENVTVNTGTEPGGLFTRIQR